MSFLMVHDQNENAHVALAEGVVGGEKTPIRRYQQDGKFLNADIPANALEHDLEQLRQLGYRVATPNEMNDYHAQKRKRESISETTILSVKQRGGGNK